MNRHSENCPDLPTGETRHKGLRIGRGFLRTGVYGLVLLLATLISYHPAWNGKPVWDDDAHIIKPELSSLSGLHRIWTEPGVTQEYLPLLFTCFWAEYGLWGDSPLGYHLTNILLHLCAAFLLVIVLRRLSIPGAWLAGAIFALHPVQVESVAWITEQKNCLSTVFFFCSLLAYLSFDRARKGLPYAAALLLFAAGLMAKASIVPLPVALLAVFYWQRGKLSFKRDIVPVIPFFAAGIASGAVNMWVERTFLRAGGPEVALSLLERGLVAGRVFWFYLGKIFWPSPLVFIYPRWSVGAGVWWQYLYPAAALAFGGTLWFFRKRWRGAFTVFIYYCAMIFPVSGIFSLWAFRFSFVADHWQHLAAIGPIVLAASALTAAPGPPKSGMRIAKTAVAGSLLLVLCFLTWKQCRIYDNVETLYRSIIAKNQSCGMAYANLGGLLLQKGERTEATGFLQKGIRLGDQGAYFNLGLAMKQAGRTIEALAAFQKATEPSPFAPKAFDLIGSLLLQTGDIKGAVANYRLAEQRYPGNFLVQNGLGYALLCAGQDEEAIVHLQRALEIYPDYFDAGENLANALQKEGRLDEALVYYRKARDGSPQSFDANYGLGSALLQAGRAADAIPYLEQAEKIRPDTAAFEENMGIAAIQMGKFAEAVMHLQRSIRADSGNALAYAELAVACGKTGNRTAAIRSGLRGINCALHAGDTSLVSQLRRQVLLFQSGSQ